LLHIQKDRPQAERYTQIASTDPWNFVLFVVYLFVHTFTRHITAHLATHKET
jgi:hypothetical protein